LLAAWNDGRSEWYAKNGMQTIIKSLGISFVGLFLVTFSAWAGTSVLEGIVKDPSGHPIKGADVRIEAKKFAKVVKTDANGHYVSDGLAVGTYKVTIVVNGAVTASILNAKTQVGKFTQLNFDLPTRVASPKKHTHLVYCSTPTGTLIGGLHGRWIEVDDNGTIVNNPGTNPTEQYNGGQSSINMRGSIPLGESGGMMGRSGP